MIKDRIICGIRGSHVKKRLLNEDDLDLAKCVKICQAAELSEIQMQTIIKNKETSIHSMKIDKNKNFNRNIQWNYNKDLHASSSQPSK